MHVIPGLKFICSEYRKAFFPSLLISSSGTVINSRNFVICFIFLFFALVAKKVRVK